MDAAALVTLGAAVAAFLGFLSLLAAERLRWGDDEKRAACLGRRRRHLEQGLERIGLRRPLPGPRAHPGPTRAAKPRPRGARPARPRPRKPRPRKPRPDRRSLLDEAKAHPENAAAVVRTLIGR